MGMLQGKVAIITGASSRIGRAAAMLFGAEGRGRPALEDVADAIRGLGEECVSYSATSGGRKHTTNLYLMP